MRRAGLRMVNGRYWWVAVGRVECSDALAVEASIWVADEVRW